jgi:hypothetical protein
MQLIQQPKQSEDIQTAVATLLVMQSNWHDFRLALQENAEPFFAGMQESLQLVQKSNGKLPLLFSGRREAAQEKLASVANWDTWKTAGATFFVNLATNFTMFASLPAHWGFLNPLLFYVKLAKSVNGGHNEVSYFGKQVTEHMFDIYQREDANSAPWRSMKEGILAKLHHYQKPWGLFSEVGDMATDAHECTTGAAEIGHKYVEHILENVAATYETLPEAKEYIGQIPFNRAVERILANQDVHRWAYHAAQMQDPWNAHLEQVFSSVLNTVGTVDDSIPIVGLFISLMKAGAVGQRQGCSTSCTKGQ